MLGILSRVRQNQLDEEEQMEVEQELADLDLGTCLTFTVWSCQMLERLAITNL